MKKFILYYFHQHYDGGDLDLIGIFDSREKAELKKEEVYCPSKELDEKRLNIENRNYDKIKEYLDNNRENMIVNYSMTLYNIEKTYEFLLNKENQYLWNYKKDYLSKHLKDLSNTPEIEPYLLNTEVSNYYEDSFFIDEIEYYNGE